MFAVAVFGTDLPEQLWYGLSRNNAFLGRLLGIPNVL